MKTVIVKNEIRALVHDINKGYFEFGMVPEDLLRMTVLKLNAVLELSKKNYVKVKWE